MKRILPGVAVLLFSGLLHAQTALTPGQLGTRVIPVSTQTVLFNGAQGYFVDVPSDASRVVLELRSTPESTPVDLFAREGQDVQQSAAGTTLADYRSEGPTGTERIEITPQSDPPLRSGRYFVAIRAGAVSAESFAFVRVTIDKVVVSDAIVIVKSDFEAREDDWTRNYPAPTPDVPGFTLGEMTSILRVTRDSVGDRNRYLELQTKGDDHFVAARQFLGNLALLGPNARIEFDLRYRTATGFANQNIDIKLFSRFTVYRWTGTRPNTEFTHYSIPLHPSAWQLISGSDSFDKALGNVLRFEIRANYGQVDGLTDLDNFTLWGRATRPLVPLTSSFDSSEEGWIRNFPEAPFLTPRAFGVTTGDQDTRVRHFRTDGNPGGYLQITDDDDVNQDFLIAPPQYLGDLSNLGLDAAFEFDRRHTSVLSPSRPAEIRLIGFGAAYRYSGELPGTTWTHYRAPLTADNWTLVEGERSFAQTLMAVQRIEVSVDDVLGGELTGFDNFQLIGSPSEVPVLSAAPESLSFVGLANGQAPASQVVEVTGNLGPTQWTAQVKDSTPWIHLEQSDGATPGALVAGVNLTGLNRGTYEGVIQVLWAGAPEPLEIPVHLTVITNTTPVISSGGVVNNANFATNSSPGGELSGGMFVAIFGEKLASATAQATVVPFPTVLATTTVTIGDLPAPLVYVSPTQIVAVVPQALTRATGVAQGSPLTEADVVVIRDSDPSPLESVRLKPVQPLIFTQNQQGTGLGAIQNVLAGGLVELNTFDTPAQPEQVITIYATGLGPTQTPVQDGFPSQGVNEIVGQAQVTIGGVNVIPSFAGLSPNSPHLFQVNVAVPQNSLTGCGVPLKLTVDGVASNEVTLAVTATGGPCR